jgi:NADPH2:quinone reductase
MLWNSYTLKFFLVYELTPEERRAAVGELSSLLQEGVLRHSVGKRFPLSRIAFAHEAVESGETRGNVVIDIG